ncbi:MAG: WYL domain-containing protein [Candidatus Nanopelagicales bacterium]
MRQLMDNSERLKRLLLELPWLSKNKSVSIEDFCKTFSVSRDQAVNDLTLLTFVGPSQFGGDLVDIQVSNNSITVVDNQSHDSSINFTPEELMVLISSLNLLIESDKSNLVTKNLYNKIINSFNDNLESNDFNYDEIFNTIETSLKENYLIKLDYIDGRNFVRKDITAKSESIEDKGKFKYLIAIDVSNRTIKSYRLDRILKVELTDQKSKNIEISNIDQVPNKLSISVPIWKKYILDGFNIEEIESDDTSIKFDLNFYDFNFVKTFLYTLGKNIRIIAENSVRDQISNLIKEDIKRFS